ncbi:MAG: hypothetical protein ACKO96_02040 [Flammeovirgaceae bacterium]
MCSETPPERKARKRWLQARDKTQTRIGTFACHTFHRDTKASK